jgi:hypothetical protein
MFTLRAQALRHFPRAVGILYPLTPGLRQIAQDLRGLFYDGTKPFESLARLLAERGSAAVAAVGPIDSALRCYTSR